MATVTPWEKGNIFGPKTALTATGEVLGRLIKAAKKPLIIVGATALDEKVNGKLLLDYAVKLSKTRKIPVVATAHTYKPLVERDLKPAEVFGVVEITDRLRDPAWSLDGKGSYDLVIFLGVTYQLQSQMLSTIKHFATHIRTMSLDRYYTPNADWSFPNLKEKDWVNNLNIIIKILKPS